MESLIRYVKFLKEITVLEEDYEVGDIYGNTNGKFLIIKVTHDGGVVITKLDNLGEFEEIPVDELEEEYVFIGNLLDYEKVVKEYKELKERVEDIERIWFN